MIFTLKNWPTLRRGYRFSVPTFYSAHHLGLDVIIPVNTPIYAWKNLNVIQAKYGTEGGNTAFIKVDGEVPLFRLMHLNAPAKTGHYKEGDIIAWSGNTGSMTTAPHLHIDLSKNGILNINNFGNFSDPEIYFKKFIEKIMIVTEEKLNQIFQEILVRPLRPGEAEASGYLGKEEEFVRTEVGKSSERQLVINAINAGRSLNR